MWTASCSTTGRPPHDGTFVDHGYGKGRAFLLAGESGFRRLVGIEFAPGLAAVCRKNPRRSRVLPAVASCTVIETDATAVEPPEGLSVAFLHNPFRGETLSRVVERLSLRVVRDPSDVWAVYVNPVGLDAFAVAGFAGVDAVRVRATLEGVTLRWDPARLEHASSAVAGRSSIKAVRLEVAVRRGEKARAGTGGCSDEAGRGPSSGRVVGRSSC